MIDFGLTRRRFLYTTAGICAASIPAWAQTLPSDKLRAGFIGVGGQGTFLLGRFLANPRVEVTALCDCNQERLARAIERNPTASSAKQYADFRHVLDSKDVDAVVIASPDHWHCLMGIHACQAGKDVYVEKPLSLCIEEGRQLVNHARLNKRVVQVGLMQRSGSWYREAIDIVQSGELGKVTVVKAWNIYNRLPGGHRSAESEAPATIDWDMWLGPRPTRPYRRDLTRGKFRWVWDFAGGNITDRGTHTMDTVLQAMDAEYPQRVSATGGKYVFTDPDDQRETPDTLNVLYDFGDWTLHYEAREANHRVNWPSGYGMVFLGTKSSLFVDRGGYRLYKERNRKGVTGDDRIVGTPGSGQVTSIHALFDPHIQNFIDCVASRKRPVCDVEIGHRSTNVSHLGNMAYHAKRTIQWDGVHEECVGDPEAQELATRTYRSPWGLERIAKPTA
ncbi:Gfo/Idh/MocA family protein [Aeoliella sp.]|uniref:Gfo/Idh/MocA family protein n=1 Tax=Aeoliella sp. TaxID=2795800 RepID=UPI003CCC02A5